MAALPKTTYLVPCTTSAGVVYLNPMHIVAIEPLNTTGENRTRIRVANALSPSESDVGGGSTNTGVEIIFTSDSSDEIAQRVEQALQAFHQS